MIAQAHALADRTALARETKRRIVKPSWIFDIVSESRLVAGTLFDCDPAVLLSHTSQLRQYLLTDVKTNDPKLLALAAGGVLESIRRVTGLTLFDVQIRAGIVVSCGAVAEMQTGEGKTLSGVLPAYVHALSGRGVHVATTNDYLARRDYEKLSPVFAQLGITTGLLRESDNDEQSQSAYQADITYGPGHAFGFDYLRDQLTLKQANSGPIGESVYERVRGQSIQAKLRQRGLHAAIVDEIDHVLIDDAVSPLLLSTSSQGLARDAEIHQHASEYINNLRRDIDFTIGASGAVDLTANGFTRVYDSSEMAVDDRLTRPWHEYVVLALRARHFYQRDIHYVIQNDEVQLVDASTGRIFQDRTWSEGLHQAVLAAEKLPVTPETESLARITRQRFYRYYQVLGGMTGTASGCEPEFASVYGLAVAVVPPRKESRRVLNTETVRLTEAEKIAAICDEAETYQKAGRAILIGTLNIAQSLLIADELTKRNIQFNLLNGVQNQDEAEIVGRGGVSGTITVATNLAGRGTDIALDDTSLRLGGLHVIVTERHSLARVDRQLIGRCARCGDPGTARFFLSAEDKLVADHALWIRRAIERYMHSQDETTTNQIDFEAAKMGPGLASIQKQLSRVQLAQQKNATRMRLQLLQMDQETETLLDRASEPSGCWQL